MHCACAILSSVSCPAVPYFPTISHKRHNFREKKLLNTKCVFWFSLQRLSETFLISRRSERNIIITVHSCSVKYPLLFRLSSNVNFLDAFSKKKKQKNSNIKLTKFRPAEAPSFRAGGRTDGQTDMTKLTFAFRNFTNGPEKERPHLCLGSPVSDMNRVRFGLLNVSASRLRNFTF